MTRGPYNDENKYVCVDPDIGKQSFEFYSGALDGEDLSRFEEHLYVCFDCQEKLRKLESLFHVLARDYEELFPNAERSKGSRHLHRRIAGGGVNR
jgi:hypothetical protein